MSGSVIKYQLPELGPEPEKWQRTSWLKWCRLRDLYRTANCSHRYDRPRWAGILGWRDDCSKCGSQYSPYDHWVDDGCEYHPNREGEEPIGKPPAKEAK